MGTEVLRPQDCLIERLRSPPLPAAPHHRYHHHRGRRNYYSAPKPAQYRRQQQQQPQTTRRQQRSKSEPSISRNYPFALDESAKNGLSMEKVTILRRGASLDLSKYGSGWDSDSDVYAGSGFAVSPEPSDLPLPSFSKTTVKKQASFDDFATRDLRRLLRLD